MPSKSKLELAVEEQVKSLNAAQREIVLSQFKAYKRNKARIAEIASKISAIDVQTLANPGTNPVEIAKRTSLVSEMSKLEEVNNNIAAKLFSQLKDVPGKERDDG